MFSFLSFAATIFFIVLLIVSSHEGEKRAAKRALYFLLSGLSFFILSFWLPGEISAIILVLITIFILGCIVLFFLPIGQIKVNIEKPDKQIDERDIPFSRVRLIAGTGEYKSYYSKRPENLASDERLKLLPGLLSLKAKFSNHIAFPAADASFDFIETFRNRVDHEKSQIQKEPAPEKISRRLKNLALYYGAWSAGITKLEKYHLYSHIGRGTGKYGDPVDLPHKFAIVFTVEMNHGMVRTAPKAPTAMESAKQYVEAARVAMQLALFISKIGFSARAHIDGNYRVIAPLIARDAGLGEIGRMGLLMTPELGPRVRIGVVTTDMPLDIDLYKPNAAIIDFCKICKKCAENCPSKSIPFEHQKTIDGALRWKIDSDSCFYYWNVVGTDCCRCMAVCPYSHPDNILHNFVRKMIQHSGFARRAALKFDDLFYGRIPEEFEVGMWGQT